MLPKVTIIGRLSADPLKIITNSGIELARFSLACSSSFRNSNNQNPTHFFNCVAWRATAGYVNQYLKKGDLIYLDGNLETNSYTDANTGKVVYGYQIVANQIETLRRKNANSSNEYNENFNTNQTNNYSANKTYANNYQPNNIKINNDSIITDLDFSSDSNKNDDQITFYDHNKNQEISKKDFDEDEEDLDNEFMKMFGYDE